jgi:hypothetical protein
MVRTPDYIRKAGSTEKVPALKETAMSYSRYRLPGRPGFRRRNTRKGRLASLRDSIPAYWVKSGVWTSA